jgi:hypothetical protein
LQFALLKGSTLRTQLMLAATMALAATSLNGQAQTMFKCVGADGKISYADQPCSGKVVAKKELDVRANLDDVERENRRKAAKREREEKLSEARNADIASDPQAQNREREARLMEGTEGQQRPATYEQIKADTMLRVKADEEARAKASALWKCKRGPAPEKCI